MLKDNKVPGTSTGTRAAEGPSHGAGSAARFFGGRQAGLFKRSDSCLDGGGGTRKGGISPKEKEKIEALSS